MLQQQIFYDKCFQQVVGNLGHELYLLPLNDRLKFTHKLFQTIANNRSSFWQKVDKTIYTEKPEYLDMPLVDTKLKEQIVEGLHFKNLLFGTYKTALKILEPLIAQINQQENRPAKILELASGKGMLTMGLAKEAIKQNFDVEITGSDLVEECMQEAKQNAKDLNLNIKFIKLDVLNMDCEENSYDIILTLHSLHHFTPEQIVEIIDNSQKVAKKAFIGIDAYREICNLAFVASSGILGTILKLQPAFTHDSTISARKMWAQKPLEFFGNIGAPNSLIKVSRPSIGLSLLEIEF